MTNGNSAYRCQLPSGLDDFFRTNALRQAIEARSIVYHGTGDVNAANREFATVLADHGFAPDEFCQEELERNYRWLI